MSKIELGTLAVTVPVGRAARPLPVGFSGMVMLLDYMGRWNYYPDFSDLKEREKYRRKFGTIHYPEKMIHFVEENTDENLGGGIYTRITYARDSVFSNTNYTGMRHGMVVVVSYLDGHVGQIPAFTHFDEPIFRTEPFEVRP